MKFSILSQRLRRLPLWVDVAFVGLVIALFCAACWVAIGKSSIDFDEAFSAYIARFNPFEISYYTALDVHPPLYYIVLHYWSIVFGTDVSIQRFLSTIWSCISLIFAFLLVRRSFGRTAAWTATILLAIEPLFFHYSGIMRMYSMAAALCLIATYVLVILTTTHRREQRKKLWIVYGILVSAGMWTNYFTALVWVAHAIWLFMERQRHGMSFGQFIRRSAWSKSVLLAVALFIPWMPAFLFRFAEVQVDGFWIKPISVDTLPSTLTMSTIYQTASNTKGWLMPIILGGIILLGFAIRRVNYALPAHKQSLLRLLIISASAPIALLILMSLPPLTSSYVYRYVLTAISFGTLVAGIVLAYVNLGTYAFVKKLAIFGIITMICISGCLESVRMSSQNLDSGKVTMVREMVGKLANAAGTAPIITWSPYTYYVAAAYEQAGHPIYYVDSPQLSEIGSLRMLADHPGTHDIKDLASFARSYDTIWVLAEEKSTAYQAPTKGWHKGRTIILTDPVTGKQPAIAVEYLR